MYILWNWIQHFHALEIMIIKQGASKKLDTQNQVSRGRIPRGLEREPCSRTPESPVPTPTNSLIVILTFFFSCNETHAISKSYFGHKLRQGMQSTEPSQLQTLIHVCCYVALFPSLGTDVFLCL